MELRMCTLWPTIFKKKNPLENLNIKPIKIQIMKETKLIGILDKNKANNVTKVKLPIVNLFLT